MGEDQSFWLHDNATARSSYLRYESQKHLARLKLHGGIDSVFFRNDRRSYKENGGHLRNTRKSNQRLLLPIFVATDGGQKYDEEEGNNRAVAAAVICMPDTRRMSDEQVRELSVDDLLKLELIPVIARISILPEEFGNRSQSSQSSHGDDTRKPSKNHHHGLVWCSRSRSQNQRREIKSP